MARIVCTWELGAHLGHLSRFPSLANVLHQHGHDLDFIFRELDSANNIFGNNPPYRFFQAPFFTHKVSTSRNPLTYSEILQCNGYSNSDSLLYLIKAWKTLFELIKPDLILHDYSPTALLAGREMDIPHVQLGTGFFIQPFESPMPCITSGQTISLEQRQQADNQVLEVINKTLSIENMSPIAHIYEIFSNAQQWLTTYPELDIFPNRKKPNRKTLNKNKEQYVGILTAMGMGTPPNWQSTNTSNNQAGNSQASNRQTNNKHSNKHTSNRANKQTHNNGNKTTAHKDNYLTNKTRIFVYLKASYQQLPAFLETLTHFNVDARLYIPNVPQELIEKYQCPHIQFSHAPYDIDAMLKSCDLTVCHAGHNTVACSLLAAKPLLLIPQYTEQLEITKKVIEHGYGASISANSDANLIHKALQSLIQNKQYQNNCQTFANRHSDMDAHSSLEYIAEQCLQLLTPST